MNDVIETPLTAAICTGYDYTENGFNIINPSVGIVYDTLYLTSVNDCDSLVYLTLTVNDVIETPLTAAICFGDDYIQNGFKIFTPEIGTRHDTLFLNTVQNCDSIVTLLLTVSPLPVAEIGDDQTIPYNTSATITATEAEPDAIYKWEPEDLIATGQGTTEVTTMPLTCDQQFYLTVTKNGCASLAIVNIFVSDQLEATITADPDEVCAGASSTLTVTPTFGTGDYTYLWSPNDLIVTGQGTAVVTTKPLQRTTTFQCDLSDGNQTLPLKQTVTVQSAEPDTIAKTACFSYEWNDNTYTESGFYTDTLTSQLGCDSVVTIDLNIIRPDIKILGYKDIYYSSDLWHGIYHYYVVDSVTIPLAPIEWQCTNPDWILLRVSDYQCKLIAVSEDTCTLIAHTLVAENCDEVMSIQINASAYYEKEDPEVTFFPNPAHSDVTVQAPGLVNVSLINLVGEKMRNVPVKSSNSAVIHTENLMHGVYLMEITTVNKVYVKRLILY